MEWLNNWVERQYLHSAKALLRSVSPVSIIKQRPGFAQTITPHKGSIVASPIPGNYDPDPDYFFHWYRDAAIVIDALRVLFEEAGPGIDALEPFADFVRFSVSLLPLDGRTLSASATWRDAVAPDFLQFLRSNDELAAVRGDRVPGETRVNPDGTLDVSKWPRPQHDGPAMTTITLLRWLESADLPGELEPAVDTLLRVNLDYTRSRWRESCFDIWEEEKGLHYYTLRVAAAALELGAVWYERRAESTAAADCLTEAREILRRLDGYWREDLQFYRSRVLDQNAPSTKELDMSVIFATLHADGTGASHSAIDPRMHATLARLEALFDADYPINRNRPANRAPAMGRYPGDVYYSGGAYYFSTLAAAEFCFRAAARRPDSKALLAHGDSFLETVRAYTPPSGDLSEQFDQRTGVQRSAQQLAWSYAAFITCAEARRHAIRQGGAGGPATV
jgi:glucoamylase